MYLNKYPERRQPNTRTFSKLVANLEKFGSFKKPASYRKIRCNEEKVKPVILAVTKNSSTSVWRINKATGIAK